MKFSTCPIPKHFVHDLDLWPTQMNVWNGTSTHDGEQLCQIILKSINNCRSYGLDKFRWTEGRTHLLTLACMHVRTHQTVIVTTMSRSPQRGGGAWQKWWVPGFSPFPTVLPAAFEFRVVITRDCVVKGSSIDVLKHEINPFPNDKFWTLPKWKSLHATISTLMKMVESPLTK